VNLKQKSILVLSILAQFIGWSFLIVSVYCYIQFIIDTGEPQRHENLIGVMLGLLYGFSFMLGSTFLAIIIKKSISKFYFKFLSIPTLVVGSFVLIMYLGSVASDLLNKT